MSAATALVSASVDGDQLVAIEADVNRRFVPTIKAGSQPASHSARCRARPTLPEADRAAKPGPGPRARHLPPASTAGAGWCCRPSWRRCAASRGMRPRPARPSARSVRWRSPSRRRGTEPGERGCSATSHSAKGLGDVGSGSVVPAVDVRHADGTAEDEDVVGLLGLPGYVSFHASSWAAERSAPPSAHNRSK